VFWTTGRLPEVAAYKRFQILRFDLETVGMLKNWSLRRGGRLREVVATGGSTFVDSAAPSSIVPRYRNLEPIM